jgi:hypothetical protein
MAAWRRLITWLFGYDIFLSYSATDVDWAIALETLLKNRFRIYRDRSRLQSGQHLDALLKAVRRSTQLMVLVSDKSVQSDWVRRELDVHCERPRAQWNITPVFLHERYPEDLPEDLRILGQFHGVSLPRRRLSSEEAAVAAALRTELTSRFKATRKLVLLRWVTAAMLLPILSVSSWVVYQRTDRGRVSQARQQAQALFADHPSPAWIKALAAEGSLDDAVAGIARPHSASLDAVVSMRVYVAGQLAGHGKRPEALNLLEEAATLAQRSQYDAGTLLVAVGLGFVDVGAADRAATVFEEAVSAVARSDEGVRDVMWTQLATALAAGGQPERAEAVVGRNRNENEVGMAAAEIAVSYVTNGRLNEADRIAKGLTHCEAIRVRAALAATAARSASGSETAKARVNELLQAIANTPQETTCFSSIAAAAALAAAGREDAADQLVAKIRSETSTLHDVRSLLDLAGEYDQWDLVDRRNAAENAALEVAQRAFVSGDREFHLNTVAVSMAVSRRYGPALEVAGQMGPSAGEVYAAIVRSYWEPRADKTRRAQSAVQR